VVVVKKTGFHHGRPIIRASPKLTANCQPQRRETICGTQFVSFDTTTNSASVYVFHPTLKKEGFGKHWPM
jgi:hypothetical protein